LGLVLVGFLVHQDGAGAVFWGVGGGWLICLLIVVAGLHKVDLLQADGVDQAVLLGDPP
jgi:hypothetical protein